MGTGACNCFMNVITGLISLALVFLFKEVEIIYIFCMMLFVIGILFALTNGIPLKLGSINNDGHNAFSLGKNKQARDDL